MSNRYGRNRRRGAMWLAVLAGLPLLTACSAARTGGKRALTWEAIYGPDRIDFSGTHASGLKWLPDGQHYLERRDDVLQQVDAITDQAAPAYDYAALEAALKQEEGFDEAAAKRLARHPTELSEDRAAALLEHGNRLYFYGFEDGTLKRLTDEAEGRREITLSPDRAYVAFVKDNNIYSVATATGQTTQLTQDGSETVLNGVLDWLYQEEIYGRGHWRSYWWSKDGRYLAYLQLDERDVPTYPLVDYLPTHPTVTQMRYPKAGDPNPKVRLGLLRPDGGEMVWVDLSKYADTDILIVGVVWSPQGRLFYCVQDRESRWLELNEADVEQGSSRTLLREASPAWVEYENPPHWLDDGSFLWCSARDGWKHLYHYTRDGELIRRLTEGAWEVGDLYGVEAASGWVYFSATRYSPVETHAYRVKLDGGEIERLTEPGFSHHADFDPHFGYFIDTFSNITTPTKVYLRRSNGELVRVVSANEVAVLDEYRFSRPELVRVPTPEGHALNALLIRPPNFDRRRKYPVFTLVYGGPHMPIVRNRWGGQEYIFRQWLAQQGYIVWVCDPYSASGEGAVSAWHAYQRLGVTELADLEASVNWLAVHENVDRERVTIFGHSYGGFMAAYALTHGHVFTTGIAVAALTDWRNYDTVYAERYLRTPQNDPEGYEVSSVVAAAGGLHGRLLLLHGVRDDNVHLQNVMQLVDALQRADKEFELMLYPRDDHGVHEYYARGPKLGLEFIDPKPLER